MFTKCLSKLAASGVAASLSVSLVSVVNAQALEVEEVIVTAQKRAERSVDVPMALTVLNSDDLEVRGVRSLQDLSVAVPGLAMRADGPGSLQVFMRGIGNLAGAEALTSFYMDETPTTLYLWRQLDLRSLDIDHVEVLKGPQGTLYGQGAAAGTVRFITRKPVMNRFEGRTEAELSFIDHGDSNEKVTAIVNAPLVDDVLAVRIAASGEWGGGWIDQPEAGIKDGNNQDVHNIRGKVLWKPTEAWEILGTVVNYRLDSVLGLDHESADRTNNVGIDRARRIRPRIDSYELYNLTSTYDFGTTSLTSATSYIDYRRDYTLPSITPIESRFYPVGGREGISTWDDRTNQFTQELRLVSNGDTTFKYTVGAFYRDVSSDFSGPILAEVNGVEFPPFFFVSNNASKSWSVFADGSVKVGKRTELGVGVRSFRDESRLFESDVLQEDTFKSTDPRVYATFALNDNTKLYANVAKGFRSGGFNESLQPPYGPEKIINYEIGAKGTLPDARVGFEVAAYFTDYQDMIRRGLVIVGDRFINTNANIGNVEIKGVEAALTWRATDALTLSGSGSYIDTEVVKIDATESANIVGDPSDYVPKLSYTLAADYTFQWSANMDGFAHVDVDHRDEITYTDRYMYFPEYATQSSDAFTLLNARLGMRWKQMSFELFARNITNENKALDPFHLWYQSNRTKPRTIGLQAAFDF